MSFSVMLLSESHSTNCTSRSRLQMIQSLHTMWDCETVFDPFFFLETVNPAPERYTSGEN